MRFKFRYSVKPTRIFRRALTYVTAQECIPRRVAAGLLALWLTVTLSADKSANPRSLTEPPLNGVELIPDTSDNTNTVRFPVFGEIHFPETDAPLKE